MTETPAAVRPATTPDLVAGTTRHRPDIEGLRAVAAALIVACHAGVPGLAGGYLGVDVFFVIAGFLLIAAPQRTLLGHHVRRTLPVVSLVLVTVLLVAGDAPPLHHLQPLAVGALGVLAGAAVAGLLVWLGFRWASPWILAAAVSASAVWSSTWSASFSASPAQPAAWPAFLSVSPAQPAAWAAELGLGCLLALAAGRLHLIPDRIATAMAGIGLALIVVAALTFDTATPVAVAAVLPVLGAVLVLAGRGGAVLGWAPLQYLGRLAFALYLWHWPVLALAERLCGEPLHAGPRAVLILISLALATVTFVCVEEPIRRSALLRRSRALTALLAALLIAAPLVAYVQA